MGLPNATELICFFIIGFIFGGEYDKDLKIFLKTINQKAIK